jgi:hypothetical protein
LAGGFLTPSEHFYVRVCDNAIVWFCCFLLVLFFLLVQEPQQLFLFSVVYCLNLVLKAQAPTQHATSNVHAL